jgi:hypothetical protein
MVPVVVLALMNFQVIPFVCARTTHGSRNNRKRAAADIFRMILLHWRMSHPEARPVLSAIDHGDAAPV